MSQIKNNFIESVGNTPLIKLKAASEITGCNIYGKAEYLNPGGSVKDRAALALIKDAQEKKLISEGGIVVEGTAGNTGIGLCLLGNLIFKGVGRLPGINTLLKQCNPSFIPKFTSEKKGRISAHT